jgi:multisubunit Na+/H+ antiporter MnhB subunit
MIAVNSAVARRAVAIATPLAIIIGIYLLFAGHNRPGGGFAAGLVLGCALALQRLTALPSKLNVGVLMATGIVVIVSTAALPLVWGDVMLDQAVDTAELPLLGKVKSGTALPFDIGVMLIVVGLVAALLDGLGVRSTPGGGEK